uniref:Uncharacterized protein n=1 Tax=Cacopsylla melanoneura TaxID=428564 RepID=A0A8D8Q709_9HEMI
MRACITTKETLHHQYQNIKFNGAVITTILIPFTLLVNKLHMEIILGCLTTNTSTTIFPQCTHRILIILKMCTTKYRLVIYQCLVLHLPMYIITLNILHHLHITSTTFNLMEISKDSAVSIEEEQIIILCLHLDLLIRKL